MSVRALSHARTSEIRGSTRVKDKEEGERIKEKERGGRKQDTS